MRDLVEFIVKQLVTNPEAVNVVESSQEGGVSLILSVDPVDMGLVIGKKGQTIRAIRKLLTVRAMAENVRVNLQLNDPEGGRRPAADEAAETAEAEVETTPEAEVVSKSESEDSAAA